MIQLIPHNDSAKQTTTDVAALNRRYLQTVRHRALCGAVTVNTWRGATVCVFLRHESDHVFAVACEHLIGMADYVALDQATFVVDEPGRQAACAGKGDLPNGRNVHAFVRGTLAWATMHDVCPVPAEWNQIIYQPHTMTSFQLRNTGQPIDRADRVIFTPRPMQLSCPPAAATDLRETRR